MTFLALKLVEASRAQPSIGRVYKLEKALFNIYAMKGQIILDKGLDAEDYDTSYERECHC